MDLQKVQNAAGLGALYTVGTLCGTSLAALASRVHTLALVKKSLSVAAIWGVSAFIATMIHQFTEHKSETPERLLANIAAVFAVTAISAPMFSHYLLGVDITYLQSLAFTSLGLASGTALGGLGALGYAIYDQEDYVEVERGVIDDHFPIRDPLPFLEDGEFSSI